jgi:anti-sigma B factor antagonist
MRELRIQTQDSSDATVVAVEGELDVASAARLVEEVGRSTDAADRIVVDLSGLSFMDSTGLRALLSASEIAEAAGCSFAVVKGPHQVQRLLRLTRVAERLAIIDGAPAAEVNRADASDGDGRPSAP